jgi:hypothetical protein
MNRRKILLNMTCRICQDFFRHRNTTTIFCLCVKQWYSSVISWSIPRSDAHFSMHAKKSYPSSAPSPVHRVDRSLSERMCPTVSSSCSVFTRADGQAGTDPFRYTIGLFLMFVCKTNACCILPGFHMYIKSEEDDDIHIKHAIQARPGP